MMDETIAPTQYRTGRGDRSIPLGLALASSALIPLVLVATGPFLWPWGVVAALGLSAVTGVAFRRWSTALETVRWNESLACLTFRRGTKEREVSLSQLTAVRTDPSSIKTILVAGREVFLLSHRLVRVDQLLDRIRRVRPDLFPEPQGELRLRASAIGLGALGFLAAGIVTTAAVLLASRPWLSIAFGLGSLLLLFRILFRHPLAFVVAPGQLTVHYLLGKRRWGRPTAVREDGYAAAGAVFFRMRVEYGERFVVLDEGDMVDPIRPRAGWIVHQLTDPQASDKLAF